MFSLIVAGVKYFMLRIQIPDFIFEFEFELEIDGIRRVGRGNFSFLESLPSYYRG